MDAVNIDQFNAAVESFFNSEEGAEYRKQLEHVRSAQKAAGDKARNLPHIFRGNMADGVYRYAEGGENFALIKDGDSYTIYDYESRNITKPSTIQEVNKALREFWNNKNNSAETNVEIEIEKTQDSETVVAQKKKSILNSIKNIFSKGASKETRERVIKENIKKVGQMKDVSALSGEEFKKGQTDLVTQVTSFFDSLSNNAENEELGSVILDRRGVKDDIAHGIGRKKAASFAAVPDVIKNGKVVDYRENWKNRGYDTAVIAAPISIDGTPYLMGIVLIREGDGNRFYVHEVLSMEKGTSSFKTGTDINNGTPGDNAPSVISILQNIAKINTSEKKSYTLPEIMKLAKEKVKGYEDMNESKKLMVRGVIREALANGFSESDAVLYARVAARSGVSIKFDKVRCSTGFVDEDGNVIFADGFYSRASNEIVVNPDGTRSTSKLLIHELAHAIYKTRTGALILEKGVKNLTDEQKKSIADKYGAIIEGDAKEYKLNDEKNAHYAEDILGDDKLLEKLLEDKPTLMDKILNFFKSAESDYADDERLSKEARKLYRHYKKLFDKFAERNQDNNLLDDRGEAYVRDSGDESYALNIKYTDGSVEVLADVRGLTNEQAVNYLKQAKSGQIRGHSYIPVRKDTPQVIIDTLNSAGERVDNLSLVMQVRKAQQAMSTKNAGNRSGNNVRSHALRPEDVVEIINKLDEPNTIILQTNRQDKDGNALPNNVAVFVDYSADGKEGFAVIEFESSIDPEFVNDEFGDANYHTVVTLFEPDTERNGEPFDYAEELLSNPNSINLEIIRRRQPQRSATREKHPNTSKELPSNGSISQNLEKSTQNDENNYALPDNVDYNKVTVSKGTLIKQKANYESEKVFSKKDITETLGEIKAFAELRTKVRENIIDRLWQGYNSRVDEQGYEKYTLVMKDKLIDELYESSMTDEEAKSLKKQIKLALDKIVENGKPSIKSRMKDTVMKEAKSEVTKDFKLFNQIGYKANQMKDLKLGTFLNATQYKPDIFKGSVETLASVMYRGTMSVKKARNAVANLKEWYTKDNPMLMFESEQNPGLYVKGVAEMLEELYRGVDISESVEKDGIVKQEVAKEGVARQYSPPSNKDIAERAGGVNTNSGLSPTDNISKNSISQDNKDVNNYLNSEKLVENAKKVVGMESVATLSKSEFSVDGKTSLKDRVVSFFDSFGNKVTTKEIGTVAVTASSFRDDKAHGLTYNKVIAFKAIPEVLAEGRVIDVYKPNGKPYTRITIAAPIVIGTEKFYMGVMVQKDNQSNRMYLHDVITEKATTSFTTEPTTHKGEGIRDEGHLFITSILQKALNVNNFADEKLSKQSNDQKSKKKFSPNS